MRSLAWLALGIMPAAAAPAEPIHIGVAGRDVAVWKPAAPAPVSGFPVIVFSHGYTGSNTQSEFLMEAFAGAGYLALAPNHADARPGGGDSSGFQAGSGATPAEEPFVNPERWSDATYRDRAADIAAVLDAVAGSRGIAGAPADPERIGLAGHSLGGYTVLGMAGAWPSWKDHRVKAVLALSPYTHPFVIKGNLRALGVPVMYQGGMRDLGITPMVRKVGGAYALSSAPKFYVEIGAAGHFAWTNIGRRQHRLISSYSVAFFDRYLKGVADPDPLALLFTSPPPRGISSLEARLQ